MSNVTVNDTAKFFGGEYTTGDTVAHGVISLLLILPPFLLDCFVFISLLVHKKTKLPIKVTLANVVLGGLVYICSLFWLTFWYVPRSLEPGRQPWSCAISCVFTFFGPTVSFISLMIYGAVIFVIIKKGAPYIKWPVLVVVAIIPWVCGLLNSLVIFAPSYGYAPRENSKARCGADSNGPSFYAHVAFSWVVIGFGSCAVTSAFIIAIYCYIKRHSLAEDVALFRVLYKLAIFLTVSDLVLAAFQVILPTFTALFRADEGIANLVWHYFPLCLYALSTWVTPLSIIVIFEPVRTHIVKLVSCGQRKEKGISPENSKG